MFSGGGVGSRGYLDNPVSLGLGTNMMQAGANGVCLEDLVFLQIWCQFGVGRVGYLANPYLADPVSVDWRQHESGKGGGDVTFLIQSLCGSLTLAEHISRSSGACCLAGEKSATCILTITEGPELHV